MSLSKLSILAFSTPDFSGSPVGACTVQVNPEKYSTTYYSEYDSSGALGSSNTTLKFNRSPPPDLKFELLFDGTGVIDPPLASAGSFDVATQISSFEKVVADYNGTIHSPNYLELVWGTLIFYCRLVSISVDYSLFTPSGAPLRAKASVVFRYFADPIKIKESANIQSPDVTHLVRVKAGDTLPQLTGRVYGDDRYYLEVAKFNHLVDIRSLKAGSELMFPPLN